MLAQQGSLTEKQKQAIRAAIREIDPVQMAYIRRLSPAQRAEIALSMIRAGEAAAVAALRRKRPGLTELQALQMIRANR